MTRDEVINLFRGSVTNNKDRAIVLDGLIYASDGMTVVRTQTDKENSDGLLWVLDAVEIYNLFPAPDNPHWQPVPPCPPELMQKHYGCENYDCDGGQIPELCESCLGDSIDCVDCTDCNGYGVKEHPCPHCKGEPHYEYPFLQVAGATLTRKTLSKIMQLPGVEICALPTLGQLDPVAFRYREFEGFAMPALIGSEANNRVSGLKWWEIPT